MGRAVLVRQRCSSARDGVLAATSTSGTRRRTPGQQDPTAGPVQPVLVVLVAREEPQTRLVGGLPGARAGQAQLVVLERMGGHRFLQQEFLQT